jgi:phage tail sheath gpL-like
MDFNTIPNDNYIPLAYIEFDSTRAQSGLALGSYTLLVLGQRLPAGTVLAGVPTPIPSAALAEQYFGRGSMLASMLAAVKKANPNTSVVAIALDDAPAAVAASGTITFTGAATQAGTLNLYIAGTKVPVLVNSGDAPAAIATAVAAAIAANTQLPVTAVAALGVVTLTAVNKGLCGNDVDVRLNYYTGEQTPAGVDVALVAMSAGTSNPDMSTAIAAMGDIWYQAIVMPYTDAASLTDLETELLSRFGGVRQIDGVGYTAFRGTAAATDTFGQGRNSPLMSCMGTSISPTPPCIVAAVNGAVAAFNLDNDPARPLQTLVLPGVLPPAEADRFTWDERQLQLHSGISTFNVDSGGNVLIERQVTMYQKNAQNIADTSYLDVTTIATLSYLRWATRARITTKYPRCKLAGDTVKVAPGQPTVTPSIIKTELVALGQDFVDAGLIEDLAQYKADLLVQINAQNPNRVDVLASPNLVNGLTVFAEQIQFIL